MRLEYDAGRAHARGYLYPQATRGEDPPCLLDARQAWLIKQLSLAERASGPNVLGQMTVIMLSLTIRPTPFRDVYQRLTARGMRPAAALGHVAGKLSVVLHGMLKNMRPYDERKHREQLGLLRPAGQVTSAPVEVSVEPPVVYRC